jgi:hypothetical protein
LFPRMRERTPAPTGAAASFGLGAMSVPKFRPKPCFAIRISLGKEWVGHNSFFAPGKGWTFGPAGLFSSL